MVEITYLLGSETLGKITANIYTPIPRQGEFVILGKVTIEVHKVVYEYKMERGQMITEVLIVGKRN